MHALRRPSVRSPLPTPGSVSSFALVVGLALAGMSGGLAGPPNVDPGPPAPLVRIEVADSSISIPDILPSGLVRLRLVDHGRRAQRIVLTRLRPRQSATAYLRGAQRWLAGGDFGLWGVDPGTPGMVAPGDSTDVLVQLHPGHYVMARWSNRADGSVRIRMATKVTFEVLAPPTGVPPAAAPEPDLSVRMTDDAYRFSGSLTPGHHVLRIANYGFHEHDFELVRLLDGHTPAEARSWLGGGMQGPAPVKFVGGLVAVSPGLAGYLDVTLEPGHYLAVCLVPAGADRRPRVDQGMLASIRVPLAGDVPANGPR
ncbi:MAG: hypothetical protein Q8W49_06655 [Candidatus Palauibacterales bacterium]|nr:hypothetical protein [Candidatus Palauibacterales bacterium]